MRQHAPSSTGQITTEAWSAMRDAAHRAGLPLDQWLRGQLFGSLPPESEDAEGSGSITDLHRRVQDLALQIEKLATRPSRTMSDEPLAPPPSYAESKLDAALRQINQRLGEIGTSQTRFEDRPSRDPSRTPEPRSRERSYDPLSSVSFERRLNDIMREPALPETRDVGFRDAGFRDAGLRDTGFRDTGLTDERLTAPSAIEAAVAEIAARQNELDRYGPAEKIRAENLRAENLRAEPSRPPREPVSREAAPRDVSPREAASSRTTWTCDVEPAETAGTGKMEALQRELAEMRRSLDQLAPRKAVAELQRTVTSLAERVERSGAGDEELRSTLQMLREAIGGLRLPEHGAVINGRIDTLQRKIDLLSAKSIDGSTIARLQAQTSEIRDLLARSLSTDSVRMLAEQVALLASKLTAMSGAHENMMRSLVSPLEHRIDRLADRIETHSASIPNIPVDDIFRRLDSIQHSLATARREAPAGMEALFEGLSERIKRIERPTVPPNSVTSQHIDALSRQIATLADKVESAGHPSDQLVGQLSGIERTLNDLFIQVEETRATLFANNGTLPPPGAPGSGPQGGHQTGSSLLRREMAAIEAARASAAASAARAQAARNAAAPAVAAAAIPTPAPAAPEAFEPEVMRAALEALERSSAAPAAEPMPVAAAAPVPAAAPQVASQAPAHDAPLLTEADLQMPVDLDGDTPPAIDAYDQLYSEPEVPAVSEAPTPGRVDFIARARRAAQPAPSVPPSTHYHIGHRQHREPSTPWLSRIRAMLLIGACGSALAFASWQLIGAMRQAQLQAVAPASGAATPTATARTPAASGTVAPEDITGSIGAAPANSRAPSAAQAPAPAAAPAPAPLAGPSSMTLPSDLPGGIGTPAMRAAALAGDPAAAYEIAHRYIEGIGVPSNAARAAAWFDYAASRGSVPAAYRLGAIYERGVDGVARDVARARKLYEQAASAGNVRAMHNLGVLLAAGIDGQPDYRAAAEWFTRAAERGVRDSQYNLAVLYARGFGVAMDLSAAWQWFSLAAASGDNEAAVKRDEIAKKLDANTLAAAKTTVEGWSPKVVDANANSGPGGEPDPQPRKTASR